MHASKMLAIAALWSSSALAMPANEFVEERAVAIEKRAAKTAPWVTVDDEGQPAKTYTPTIETSDGTTTVKDAAPHDITASVFTWQTWEKVYTSTGAPPNPTAMGKNGEGAFARCYNKDGPNAPFCDPAVNSTLLTGNTYYVTWDPDFFNKTRDNTTFEVSARIDWYNKSSEAFEKFDNSPRVPAAWGFWPFRVDTRYLNGQRECNITITLLSNVNGSSEKDHTGPLPLLLSKPALPEPSKAGMPKGQTLAIALPTVFGSIVLLLIGGCLWNRKTRRIELGNVMSRSRHGYTGRKARNLFRKDRAAAIPIPQDDPTSPSGYRDAPDAHELGRRDSDALGSLAGSPIDPSFRHNGPNNGNAFREEIRRQDMERH